MKKLFFCWGLSILFIATSCSNNDSVSEKSTSPLAIAKVAKSGSLNGSWSLIKHSGGFAGIIRDYNVGEIVWEFNEISHTMTVVKSITSNGMDFSFAAGTYTYLVESNGFHFVFDSIGGETSPYITFSFDGKTLVLREDGIMDGYNYELRKN